MPGSDEYRDSGRLSLLRRAKGQLRATQRLTDYASQRASEKAEEVLSRAGKAAAPRKEERVKKGFFLSPERIYAAWRESWVAQTSMNLVWAVFFVVLCTSIVIFLRNIAPNYGIYWIGDS